MDVNYFWDENQMRRSAFPNPTILAIGDSWFWYPFFGGSLVNNLGEIVRSKGHVILAKGMNGAEAVDFVEGGKYGRSVAAALRLYGAGLEAVFISGGGNDFAGLAQLRPLLKSDCSRETEASGCFDEGAEGLKAFLERVDASYRQLIGQIYTRTPPDCKVVMHCYAYPVANGKGLNRGQGWLLPALVDAGVPPALHQACLEYVLDAFCAVLHDIRRADPERLLVVDSRRALGPRDWANELHPTAAGFRKIARQYWKPVLEAAGLA
jgi:lysophospholipase L1-like esterase